MRAPACQPSMPLTKRIWCRRSTSIRELQRPEMTTPVDSAGSLWKSPSLEKRIKPATLIHTEMFQSKEVWMKCCQVESNSWSPSKIGWAPVDSWATYVTPMPSWIQSKTRGKSISKTNVAALKNLTIDSLTVEMWQPITRTTINMRACPSSKN